MEASQVEFFDTSGVKQLLDAVLDGWACLDVLANIIHRRYNTNNWELDYLKDTFLVHTITIVLHVCSYTCTAFAFGQTGSGKTYTITGPDDPDPTQGTSVVSLRCRLVVMIACCRVVLTITKWAVDLIGSDWYVVFVSVQAQWLSWHWCGSWYHPTVIRLCLQPRPGEVCTPTWCPSYVVIRITTTTTTTTTIILIILLRIFIK
jgi:hypothetical protein